MPHTDTGANGTSSVYHLEPGQDLPPAVVLSVADATATAPAELPSLDDALDPREFDGLLTAEDESIEFAYADCEVAVHSDGRIVVAA